MQSLNDTVSIEREDGKPATVNIKLNKKDFNGQLVLKATINQENDKSITI